MLLKERFKNGLSVYEYDTEQVLENTRKTFKRLD